MQLQISCVIPLYAIISIGSALKIVMLDIPNPVAVGDSVELTCSYDLEKESVYAVKFYKHGSEFYRYVPKAWPPAHYFPLPGIKVDLSRSDKNKVFLKNVDLNSAGLYRCEVSMEAPSFDTAAVEKEMQIYALPSERPEVRIDKKEYRVGEILTVGCISSKSKPAQILTWQINGNKIRPQVASEFEFGPTVTPDLNGLETSSLTLRFTTQKEHFKNGVLRLKCVATIPKVYRFAHETELAVSLIHDEKDPRSRPQSAGKESSPSGFSENMSADNLSRGSKRKR